MTKESLTVKEAIKKGKFWVSGISTGLLVILILVGMVLNSIEWISDYALGMMVVIGFSLSGIYWSIASTKWKIWGFTNVRNVHHLLERAYEESILPKENSFSRHLQFWSSSDKKKWEKLQLKFKEKDIRKKAKDFPKVMKIYADRPIIIFYFTLNLFLLWFISLMIIEGEILWLSIPVFCGIAYLAFGQYRKLFFKKPQLTLSKKGIESVDHTLYRWTKIKDVKINKQMHNNAQTFYLEYRTPKEFISLRLDLLKVDIDDLREAIRIYGHKKIGS